VEPGDALADLLEISSYVRSAVLCDPSGGVRASTLPDDAGTTTLARSALDLLAAAASLRPAGAPPVARVQASFRDGSLFAVREGESVVAAVTVADSPAGLVLYDLRTALRKAAPTEQPSKPRRRRTRPKVTEDADAAS
jgi:hypothetical protein